MTRCKDGLKNWVKAGGDKEAALSAKPTALEAVPTDQPGENVPFRSTPALFSSPCSTTLVLASVDPLLPYR